MPKWDDEPKGICNECTLRAAPGCFFLYVCDLPEGHSGPHHGVGSRDDGAGGILEWGGSEDGEKQFDKYWRKVGKEAGHYDEEEGRNGDAD